MCAFVRYIPTIIPRLPLIPSPPPTNWRAFEIIHRCTRFWWIRRIPCQWLWLFYSPTLILTSLIYNISDPLSNLCYLLLVMCKGVYLSLGICIQPSTSLTIFIVTSKVTHIFIDTVDKVFQRLISPVAYKKYAGMRIFSGQDVIHAYFVAPPPS